MQKEIVEYYCDVCGKKMDWSIDLKEIKIPVSHTEYSFLRKKIVELCIHQKYAQSACMHYTKSFKNISLILMLKDLQV